MDRFALLVMLRAKPGKEREVEEFLVAARPIVLDEVGTVSWYAVKFDDGQYGIFDTFADGGGQKRSPQRPGRQSPVRKIG